ncbi:hypothetical protein FSP39_009869 [Pinctada imbricata]|uniref:Uncharacterized protein n=1 Tax=Pinctada imbricata TaxID=66713 RepID=A0AA89C8P8_PINIB|nr:hypothetical protein FSP39_009869 [Pinctada imbricata]
MQPFVRQVLNTHITTLYSGIKNPVMRLVVIIVLAVLGSILVESCDDERKGTLELLSKIIDGLGGKHGGKNKCMDSWTKQYSGYLMSGRIDQAPSQYICVDGNAEKIGTKTNLDGKLLVPVEARCGSLRCPPYKNGRELTCVVCAK